MTNKKLSLQIEDPCSQNWINMSPAANGRYCLHCTKVVTDFTTMTDNQIKEFFKSYTGEICGRFETRQLEQSYIYDLGKSPSYFNRFLQFAISGLLTLKLTDSTSQDHTIKMEQVSKAAEEINHDPLPIKANNEKILEGKVCTMNLSPLKNSIVKIEETEQTFTTDSTGKFKFELPSDFKGKQITVTSTHSYYESATRIINISELPIRDLTFRMYYEHTMKGKVKYIKD